MNYGIKLKSLNNIKKTYESSISRSKLASLSHGNLSSRNSSFHAKKIAQSFPLMKKSS